MAITVDTKLIPLLGTPLRQSFSPRMQNAAYKAIGFDGHYFPVEVGTEGIGAVINGLRHMNTPGFAVTKPNKVEAIQYLDELDELAQKMGAVNTVVNNNGVLKGYNTDGWGAVSSLIQEGVNIKENTFFVFGAGGSGRAVAFALAHHGAKRLNIISRSNSCVELAKDLNDNYGDIAVACQVGDQEKMLELLKESTVILNLSGIGMYPNTSETWIDKSHLAHKPVCFDATYNPLKTQFLLDAESVGCKVINGLGWVIHQGALQVKLWTGQDEPFEAMRAEIEQILKEHSN